MDVITSSSSSSSSMVAPRRSSSVMDPEKKKKKKKKKTTTTTRSGGEDDVVVALERKKKKRVVSKSKAPSSSTWSSSSSSSSLSCFNLCCSAPMYVASLCAAAILPSAGPKKTRKLLSDGDTTTARTTSAGLTLAALIVGLYAIGTIESVLHLPEVNPAMRANWFVAEGGKRGGSGITGGADDSYAGSTFGLAIHGGGNMNVARDGLVPVDDADFEQGGSTGGNGVEGGNGVGNAGRNGHDDDFSSNGDGDQVARRRQSVGGKPKQLRGAAGNKRRPTDPIVPQHKWPCSIRDEDGQFVDIAHPGDSTQTLTVPRFWSDPIHNGQLMTRDLAMSVGSCSVPDRNGNVARGDSCPKNDRTIYVAIASYRDWQCRFTVESIYGRASFPDRIRVGVVDQIVADEDFSCESPIKPCTVDPDQALCKYAHLVDVYQMDAIYAVGPVFARHVGHRMYRGEYYAMQSDAHVSFTKGWDVDIIDQQEATGDEMAVQSTYLTDVVGSIDERTGLSRRKTRPIMCNTDYEGGAQGSHLRHLSQPERYPSIRGMPQLQPYWAAGFSFSRGHFVVNVPYDQYQPMIFQGEEMSIGLRGFTVGYDFFASEKSVCFHHYAEGPNKAKRKKVKMFWEHADKYAGTGRKAMMRLLGIVGMNPEVDPTKWDHSEEERYGLGKVRTTQKFYETFGIDVVQKKTEHNLCEFVQTGIMHKEFMKHLRKDGMGIDYGKISYRFKDPGVETI